MPLLKEWQNPFEFMDQFKIWAEELIISYLHSTLGHKTPLQKETVYFNKEKILLSLLDGVALFLLNAPPPLLKQKTPLSLECSFLKELCENKLNVDRALVFKDLQQSR